MGGLMSLAVSAEGLGLLQSWHYGSRAEKLTKLAYELDFQGLRLDVLGTIREEIRDQVFVIMSSLDTLMVVATLMLTLGFGFVVEGTFPPKSAEALGDWTIPSIGFSIDPLVVYAFLCAMSLVCPFWCLIFTIRMRYEVDLIVRQHMQELKKQLCNVIQRREMQAPDETEQHVSRECSAPLLSEQRLGFSLRGTACPKRLRQVLAACPARRQDDIEEAANAVVSSVAQTVGPFGISSQMRSLDQAQIVKWAEKDLLQRMTTYRFYIKAAHLLLWMGMLCAIFTCSILLGLYMMEQFPNTPLVWITYSHIVGLNGGLAILFAVWMWWSSANPVAASTGRPGAISDPKRKRSSYSTPLLENSSPSLFSCSPKAEGGMRTSFGLRDSSLPAVQELQATLKVRDASSGLDAYRQVTFPFRQTGGYMDAVADFNMLEQRICMKFRNRRGKKVAGLKSLVRLRDRVEITDDEDVSKLCDGDELEAVFFFSIAD